MPIPGKLVDDFDCESIDFFCSNVQYSDGRKVFTFMNPFFIIFEDAGFRGNSFQAMLPDAKPEVGFTLDYKSGGILSTDKSITYDVSLTEVDHVRYAIMYNKDFITLDDLSNLVAGECEYQETTESITIEFTQGYGRYTVLALAYDAEDKYMGIYGTYTVLSNLAPEGTWESIGKGIWHYPGNRYYDYYDSDKQEMVRFTFPEDKLQWEVEIEKRTDTDREIYRVVNPYSPTCGLAEPVSELLDKMYKADPENRPVMFADYDTFWFVFDVTDQNNITFEAGRPNGVNDAYFMATTFEPDYESKATYKDKQLRISGYSNDLVVDMPGYRGLGFEYSDQKDGNVYGKVSPATTEVRYVLIPSSGAKPSEAELASEADKVVKGSTSYEVHKVARGESGEEVSLPYADYLESPSWMLVVPVDGSGEAFDYSVVSLEYRTEFTGASMIECLLSPLYGEDLSFEIKDLTITRITYPENLECDYYTLPNPYKNDPGWYTLISVETKEVGDWTFVHDHSEGKDVVTLDNAYTGVSIVDLFNINPVYLVPVFEPGTKTGDVFTFPLKHVALEGYTNTFDPEGEANYVFYLSGNPGASGIEDVIGETSDADAPVEYYDLQGRRVVNPSAGIYIRRQGGESTKVYVK